MTNLNLSDVRIFLCTTPTKMSYSFDTLMGQAQAIFDQDPLSGHLFLFFNRDRDRVKVLFWDHDGFCIWYKRWVHGRRRERIVEGKGQQHLFDLTPPGDTEVPAPREEPRQQIAGLIAQIVVSKFGDHLPLYRQEDIFVRHGLHLARSTLCDWVSAAAQLLEPLYDMQRQLALQSAVMWTDDTPVKVLAGGEEGCRQGRFWTYIGDDEYPYSVYDFTMSRSRDGPQSFLRNFRGSLHADAYAGYDAIFLGSGSKIVEVACWAHARRKFFDARNQWDALRCYTTDGRLTIDNNTSERTLRHQAIGRKNWLFLGSKNAGPRAAVLYTILAGAKRHRLEPWAYVRELLMRLHADDARLDEMLPDRWATQHPEAVLQHRLEESRAKAAAKRDRRQRRRAPACHQH